MAFKVRLPSRFTSLIGVTAHMFRGNEKVEIAAPAIAPWPEGADKVSVGWSKPVVLRDAMAETPVSVKPGGYVALRQRDGSYGFVYDKVFVDASEDFWKNRVNNGFVTVFGQ